MKLSRLMLMNIMPHALSNPQALWGTKEEMDHDSPL